MCLFVGLFIVLNCESVPPLQTVVALRHVDIKEFFT